MIGPQEHSQKGVTDRRTDAVTPPSISISAMVADKNFKIFTFRGPGGQNVWPKTQILPANTGKLHRQRSLLEQNPAIKNDTGT